MSNFVLFLYHCFVYSLIVLAHDRPLFLLNSVDNNKTLKLDYFSTPQGGYNIELWVRWVGFLLWKPYCQHILCLYMIFYSK
jgi:hypothetical protein